MDVPQTLSNWRPRRRWLAKIDNALEVHSSRILWAAAGGVLLLGVLLSIALGTELRYPDERSYLAIADNLAHHGAFSEDGTSPTAWQPPAFAMLLAPLRLLHVPVVGLRIANVMLLAASLLVLATLARRIFNPRAAALTAIGMVLAPLLLYTAVNLYPQALSLFLLASLLLVAHAAEQACDRRRAALAAAVGLLGGALVLTAPTYALVLPILLVRLTRRIPRALAVAAFTTALIAALLLPAAWTIRNVTTFHSAVFISTDDGSNLLLGNNPRARPGSTVDTYPDDGLGRAGVNGELRRSRIDRRRAVEWITSHPAQAAWLYLGKYANNFNWRNEYHVKARSTVLANLVGALTYLPMLVLFLLRVVLALRRLLPTRPFESVLIFTVLAIPLLIAVFTTRLRYRTPLDAVQVVVVAGMTAHWLGAARVKGRRPGSRRNTPDDAVELSSAALPAVAADADLATWPGEDEKSPWSRRGREL